MLNINKKNQGFTLIEMAVVLIIISILLGGFIGNLAQRVETTKREQTLQKLKAIKTAIVGFALTNGRLPCPASPTTKGNESPDGGGVCSAAHGFVAGKTLGIAGNYNLDGLLLDSWSNPFRYSVTTSNGSAFTKNHGIQKANLDILNPDIKVCTEINCNTTTGTELVKRAPFIVLSLGSDGADFIDAVAANSYQGENASERLLAANSAGENIAYTVANDNEFIKKSYSDKDATAGKFDDMLIWVSPFVLYNKMLESGVLD